MLPYVLACDRPAGKVPLGEMVIGPHARRYIVPADIGAALHRHANGDWGTVNDKQSKENDRAMECGGLVLSHYKDSNGHDFWIATKTDQSMTMVLSPEDIVAE